MQEAQGKEWAKKQAATEIKMTLLEKQLKKERELRRVQEGKGKEQEKRAKRVEAQLAELEGEMTRGVGSLSGSSLRRVRRLLKAAPSTKSSPKRDKADAAMKATVDAAAVAAASLEAAQVAAQATQPDDAETQAAATTAAETAAAAETVAATAAAAAATASKAADDEDAGEGPEESDASSKKSRKRKGRKGAGGGGRGGKRGGGRGGDSDGSSSSSSSSSSSDDDSEDTLDSLMRAKREERRRRKKRDNRGMLDRLVELAGTKRVIKEKKIQINKPDSYDGTLEAKPPYRKWFRRLNDYLHHYKGTWDDDEDLIRIFGSFMTGEARDWFDTRADTLEDNRQTDTFSAFVSAMDERFKVDFEKETNYRALSKVKYTGNVLQYIDKLRALNQKVGIAGITWQEILKDGLPQVLRMDLAKVKGGVPDDDDALIVAIKEIGLAHERFLAEEKARGNSVAGQDSGPKKGKDKKRKRGPEKETNAKEDSAPASKKLQKGKGTASGSGDTKPRFSKDQMDEALKGVPQNLRDARDKKNMCRRCGLDNHRWQWCRKEISVSSTRKKKDKKESKGKDTSKKETSPAPAASSLKRKAPTNTVSVGVHSLPCAERILANLHWKAGSSKRARVASAVKAEGSSDSEEEPKRVWEINSEEERNM